MRVYKDTPFELSMMPWELEPPRTTLMLVVKATYALGDDNEPCTLMGEQVPCLGPIPWEDGDNPSLRFESDYAILKPRGEWYVGGHAYPGGEPAPIVPVRVRIGPLWKEMVVFGDREWKMSALGRKPTDPIPFESTPLRWERSFGAPEIHENPVGRGKHSISTESGKLRPLPNIEDPKRPIVAHGDWPEPMGMAAIPGGWRARAQLTGTYDELWVKSRWPFLPEDFDFRFFNCAPEDQQLPEGFWRGDEPMVLHGLSPTRPVIHTKLPALRPRLFVEWKTERPADATPLEMLSRAEIEAFGPPELHDVALKLDTITIDSDLGAVMCQWRGHVEVSDVQYTNLARIFVLHEPLDTEKTRDEYRAWALGELLKEADEFDPPEEADEEDEPVAELVDGADSFEDKTLPEDKPTTPEEELDLRMAEFQAKMLTFLQILDEEVVEEEPTPSVEELREKYIEAGMDTAQVDELFPLAVEEAPPVEVEEPASYLRLAALLRRKMGKPFTDLDLSGAPYRGLDLSGVDFSGSILTGADLRNAKLKRATFDGALLVRANLSRSDAREASFVGADLSEVRAKKAWFDHARFDEATGSGGYYEESRFEGASFKDAELEESDFTRAILRGCDMDGADFVGSTLDEADFSGSSMLDTSLESVHAHKTSFERCKMADLRASDGADFTGAKLVLVDAPRAQLQGTTLVDANFSGSNLEEADLAESTADRVNLMRCVLRSAKIDRARLVDAVMIQADFFEASFEEADLTNVDARGAHFHTAHLWRARLEGAVLEGAVLDRTVVNGPGETK